jgi:hypothetical protein
MERVGKSLVGKRARRSRRGWTYSGWELAAVDVGNTVVSINDDQLDAAGSMDVGSGICSKPPTPLEKSAVSSPLAIPLVVIPPLSPLTPRELMSLGLDPEGA